MSEHFDKFAEYKFFAESTQYLSERRQSATQTYLSVNTAILAFMGFILRGTGDSGSVLIVVSLALIAAGSLACWIWHKIITQYKALIGWRYDELMEMETSLPQSHQMYHKEWLNFFKPRKEKEKFGFSRLEILLPRLFLGLYLVCGLALIYLKIVEVL